MNDSPAFAYGSLCRALHDGMVDFMRQVAAGFTTGGERLDRFAAATEGAAASIRAMREQEERRRAELERCRQSVALFDVAAAQQRLDDLAARTHALRARWAAS